MAYFWPKRAQSKSFVADLFCSKRFAIRQSLFPRVYTAVRKKVTIGVEHSRLCADSFSQKCQLISDLSIKRSGTAHRQHLSRWWQKNFYFFYAHPLDFLKRNVCSAFTKHTFDVHCRQKKNVTWSCQCLTLHWRSFVKMSVCFWLDIHCTAKLIKEGAGLGIAKK